MNTSLIQFHQTGNACRYTLTSEGKKCEFLQFLINTCNFAWRKKPEDVTEEDKQREASILLSKMCAIGYMVFHIKRPDNARAVILTDYMNVVPGRSGKSLFVEFVRYFVETTQISCLHIDITNPFFLNGISEKTKLVFLDDLQPNFKLEHLFSFITEDWPINRKGSHLVAIPFRFSPKIILSTNYKIGGKGLSFDSRKWEIPFSDYYNANYSPFDSFEKYLFLDWSIADWRLAYALVADCVQLFIEHGVVSADLS